MIIAHDLGTTGNKASLHDSKGRIAHSVTVSYETHYRSGGVVEQDPEDWWKAICLATQTLLIDTSTDPKEVFGVGISGHMMGAVLLDKKMQPLRPAVIWADTRSQQQCDQLIRDFGQTKAYEVLGHRINSTYSLTKIMWLRDNEPELFAKTWKICNAKDFIVARLTGVLGTDPSDASSMNLYDQKEGKWSEELLGIAGLKVDLFPEIFPSTHVVGHVRQSSASAVGLEVGTPVVMGGGDGPIAAVGAGKIEPCDGAYVYLGSSSWISISSESPLYDKGLMRTMNFNHVVPNRFVPTATMQSGGGALNWISDIFEPGGSDERFERLIEDTKNVEAATEGLFFLPHLLGERSPYWNPNARGAFLGLSRHHTRSHVTRAVLEGVAFNLYTCINAFRGLGTDINQVDAIGGGASSDVWLQLMADIWGCTVQRRSVVDEANSLGAAVTTGVGIGLFPDFSIARDLSSVMKIFEPNQKRTLAFSRAHELFKEAYLQLEPWMNESRP